jgi:hypothetical protein
MVHKTEYTLHTAAKTPSYIYLTLASVDCSRDYYKELAKLSQVSKRTTNMA